MLVFLPLRQHHGGRLAVHNQPGRALDATSLHQGRHNDAGLGSFLHVISLRPAKNLEFGDARVRAAALRHSRDRAETQRPQPPPLPLVLDPFLRRRIVALGDRLLELPVAIPVGLNHIGRCVVDVAALVEAHA